MFLEPQATRHGSNFATRLEQRSGFAKLSIASRNQKARAGPGSHIPGIMDRFVLRADRDDQAQDAKGSHIRCLEDELIVACMALLR